MIHLRVHVVGTPCQDDDSPPLGPGLFHDPDPLPADPGHVMGVLVVGRAAGLPDLGFGDVGKMPPEDVVNLPGKILGPVEAHVVVEKQGLLDLRAVSGDDLRVIGHHRAVIMIVPQALVQIIGHAGVEYGVHAQLGEELDVSVGQLRREAGGVTGDGRLSL